MDMYASTRSSCARFARAASSNATAPQGTPGFESGGGESVGAPAVGRPNLWLTGVVGGEGTSLGK